MSMHWDPKYKLEGKEGDLDDFLYFDENGIEHIREDAPEWALRSFAYMMNMGSDTLPLDYSEKRAKEIAEHLSAQKKNKQE